MQSLLRQSDDDRTALQKVARAINLGNEQQLADALAGNKRAVKSGLPVRGSHFLPLQLAVEKGHAWAVKALLDAGAPIEQADGRGRTALQVLTTAHACALLPDLPCLSLLCALIAA
jgi:hypothetical protein